MQGPLFSTSWTSPSRSAEWAAMVTGNLAAEPEDLPVRAGPRRQRG